MAEGYLSLVLHSHLPFVRHPEYERFLEENWLFEAITETYLPLLGVFERLKADGVPFRLTISVSPTLAAMLGDPLLRERYVLHLERLARLARSEAERTRGDAGFNTLARMYLERLEESLHRFTLTYGRDLISALKGFEEQGCIELITSSATHCFLPLFQVVPQAVKAQIDVAVQSHYHSFGSLPKGIWLPECGYYPGLEQFLASNGLKYFFVEAHGILYADKRPVRGLYAPLCCPNQVAAFGRDPESSKAVWSAQEGYPGNHVYREFYRDIGFDLPLEQLEPFIQTGGVRVNTGIKYYAITGRTEQKSLYNRELALRKVQEHADHFLSSRLEQVKRLGPWMDRPPLIVCPYDAELFGHWWFEGPEWIETLLRRASQVSDRLELLSPGDYLARYKENQVATPSFSSWGNNGYAEVWLDGSNHWVYPHLHKATQRLVELIKRFPNEKGIRRRALNQAAREVLLSQASDWAFIMKMGTTVAYAVKRIREHIHNFTRIYDSLLVNHFDHEWLLRLERKNNLFPDIDYRVFAD